MGQREGNGVTLCVYVCACTHGCGHVGEVPPSMMMFSYVHATLNAFLQPFFTCICHFSFAVSLEMVTRDFTILE